MKTPSYRRPRTRFRDPLSIKDEPRKPRRNPGHHRSLETAPDQYILACPRFQQDAIAIYIPLAGIVIFEAPKSASTNLSDFQPSNEDTNSPQRIIINPRHVELPNITHQQTFKFLRRSTSRTTRIHKCNNTIQTGRRTSEFGCWRAVLSLGSEIHFANQRSGSDGKGAGKS